MTADRWLAGKVDIDRWARHHTFARYGLLDTCVAGRAMAEVYAERMAPTYTPITTSTPTAAGRRWENAVPAGQGAGRDADRRAPGGPGPGPHRGDVAGRRHGCAMSVLSGAGPDHAVPAARRCRGRLLTVGRRGRLHGGGRVAPSRRPAGRPSPVASPRSWPRPRRPRASAPRPRSPCCTLRPGGLTQATADPEPPPGARPADGTRLRLLAYLVGVRPRLPCGHVFRSRADTLQTSGVSIHSRAGGTWAHDRRTRAGGWG
ncbi:hypothetical protein SCANM63S_02435 [Streptomyces canarius]